MIWKIFSFRIFLKLSSLFSLNFFDFFQSKVQSNILFIKPIHNIRLFLGTYVVCGRVQLFTNRISFEWVDIFEGGVEIFQ